MVVDQSLSLTIEAMSAPSPLFRRPSNFTVAAEGGLSLKGDVECGMGRIGFSEPLIWLVFCTLFSAQ